MENHVFLPIISAFCLPEQERIDLNCSETMMDFPCPSKPLSSGQQKRKLRPSTQMSHTQIHKPTIISRRRISQIKSKAKCYRGSVILLYSHINIISDQTQVFICKSAKERNVSLHEEKELPEKKPQSQYGHSFHVVSRLRHNRGNGDIPGVKIYGKIIHQEVWL